MDSRCPFRANLGGKRRKAATKYIKKNTHVPFFGLRPTHMHPHAAAPAQVPPDTMLPHAVLAKSKPCREVCGAVWTSQVLAVARDVAPRRKPRRPLKSSASAAGIERTAAASSSARPRHYFALPRWWPPPLQPCPPRRWAVEEPVPHRPVRPQTRSVAPRKLVPVTTTVPTIAGKRTDAIMMIDKLLGSPEAPRQIRRNHRNGYHSAARTDFGKWGLAHFAIPFSARTLAFLAGEA